MATTLAEYTLDDLERLEVERPELGKVEVVDGSLHATGAEVTGDRHQAVSQRLFLILAAACPVGFVVRFDTYWFTDGSRLRPDVAVWREVDRPADGGAFRVPPVACCEVLSRDADHDLVRKAALYRAAKVSALMLDPAQRAGWWCRLDDTDRAEDEVEWRIPKWPPVLLARETLLAG